MDSIKKRVKLFGYVVTGFSLYYISNIFLHTDWTLFHFDHPLLLTLQLLLFGLWASLFVVIGAYNWKLILQFLHGETLSPREVFTVFIKSNVAKYLPGNVMHFAGRNFLGNKLGWKHSHIAFSSLLEYGLGAGLNALIVVALFAAELVTLPKQVTLTVNYPNLYRYSQILGIGMLIVCAATVLYLLVVKKKDTTAVLDTLTKVTKMLGSFDALILLVKLALISLFCFLLNCLFYFYLCDLILGFHIRWSDFFNANSALTLANNMSIVTPGVPGGIGVKESVSTLLIAAYGYPKETLMLSMLLFRIACVLGDVIPFFSLMAIDRFSARR